MPSGFSEFLTHYVKVVYSDTLNGEPHNRVARGKLRAVDEHFLHLVGMSIGLRYVVAVSPDNGGGRPGTP